MIRRLARRITLLGVCATLTLQALPLLAATPEDAAVTNKARALFEAGGRAYDRGQFDVALAAFEQAYTLVKRDNLLFSMGQAHRRLYYETRSTHHRDEAIRLYREFLQRVSDGDRRAEANKWLGELESTAGSPSKAPDASTPQSKRTLVYVSSSSEGATASIDGGAASPVNTAVEVTPGKHKVVVTAPGYFEETFEVDATANELAPVMAELRVRPGLVNVASTSGADIYVGGRLVGEAPLASPLELEPGQHIVVAELTGHQTRSFTVDVPRDGRTTIDLELQTTLQRDLSFVMLGLAGAAAIASGVTAGFAFIEQGKADDLLDKQATTGLEPGDIEAYNDAKKARDQLVIGASVAGAAAGALLITGLGMLLIDPPEKIPSVGVEKRSGTPKQEGTESSTGEVSVLPAIGPDGGMVFLKLTF